MPDGKTIRQIADEIGVTRQAIYKKFKFNSAVANSIKIHSFKVDRVKYYTAEGEKIIKSMFADNSNTSQSTVNLSTEQLTDKLTHDNLTTNQVDRLSDRLTHELTGLQDEKTPINSAFSDNNTSKTTVNLSTKQLTDKLTHDNLTTNQVDRLSDRLTHELTGLQDEKTPINSTFSDNITSKTTVNLSTEQLTDKLTSDNLTTNQVDRLTELFFAQLTAKDKQIEEKDRQILEKDRQLAEKDKQISMLMEQSNNLTQALQAAQALAAADKKQLLLQSGQQNNQSENVDTSENVKKGFFRKIFGK